jgi:thiol-disulfide isomerase/thioredoxin
MRALVPLVCLSLALACGGGPPPAAPVAPSPVPEVAPVVPVATAAPPFDVSSFRAAPAIRSDHWLNGDPVDVKNHDKPILVEVWGTWCGPCLPAGFHIQRIAEAHPNDLTVVGVAQDTAQKAGPFLREKGWTWRNATDPGGLVSNLYGADSVPHTFIIVAGHIVWDGHPNGVEPVLDEVLAGRWSATEAAAYAAVPAQIEHYFAVVGSPEAATAGAQLVDGGHGRPYELNELAWRILTEIPAGQQDLPLAVRASQVAVEATHHGDYAVLDTAALALWKTGKKADALALQKDAARLCAADQGSDCADIDGRLKEFGG